MSNLTYPPCGFNECNNDANGDNSNSNDNDNNNDDDNNGNSDNKNKNVNNGNIYFCNSLVSCNIQSSVSRSAITCQWRCDSTTHNHQIKNNSLRFTAIAPNCIYDFMIVLLEAALISKKHLHLLKQYIILKELS